MPQWTNEGPAIFVNADRSKVVPADSEEAAFLLVGEGGQLEEAEAERYGLLKGGQGAAVEGTPIPPDEEGRPAEGGLKVKKERPEDKRRSMPPEDKNKG